MCFMFKYKYMLSNSVLELVSFNFQLREETLNEHLSALH
jgi:hypothetical protein